MSKLKIMSNNIWYCDDNQPAWEAAGEDCSAEHRSKGLSRLYSETRPDILGLQECSALMADCLMQQFAEKGEPYALLWGKDTPIIYRTDKFELVDSFFSLFPEGVPGLEGKFNNHKTKSYCIAVLRDKESGKKLIFTSVHLWWKSSNPKSKDFYPHSDEARAWQLQYVMDKVEAYQNKYTCPAIIVGDYNAVYDSPAVQGGLKRGYQHAHDIAVEYAAQTGGHHFCYASGYDMYENKREFKNSIDHILISGAPEGFVRRFDREAPDYYMPLSDHIPVWIEAEL